MRHSRIPLFLLLLGLSAGAQAASMDRTADFYQGSAVVDSRSEQARRQGIREALVEVLVRMTGDVSVSLNERSGPILDQASRYMRSYRYVEREQPEPRPFLQPAVEPSPGPATPPLKAQFLLVDFDAGALVRAVKDAGLPLWDDLRAVTALWLLAPSADGPRALLGGEDIAQRLPSLQRAANARGIPLRLPVMDVEDRSAISPMDLIAEDYSRLAGASARYEARHLLLLQLRQSTPNLWEAQWSYLRAAGEPLRWTSLGDDANQAVASGFGQYADHLAREYALKLSPGWVQNSRVHVLGVSEVGQYARVMAYLQRLNLVESVQPIEVQGQELVFLVEFEGTLEDLQRSIELGDLLVPAPPPTPQPFANSPPGMAGLPDASGLPGAPSASPGPQAAASSGLSFFAVSRRPELRYQLRP